MKQILTDIDDLNYFLETLDDAYCVTFQMQTVLETMRRVQYKYSKDNKYGFRNTKES